MSLTDEFIRTDETFGAHNYHPLSVVLSRAEGPWVWDVEGKRYLDCLSAYSAVNQGHRHPRIVQALKDQLDRLDLTSRAFHNDVMGAFLRKLCDYTGFSSALPMNTGAEAVETGIKAARRWAYRKKGVKKDQAEIIVCSNNFHGRTTTIVGFSTDPDANEDYGPFTPGFKIIPFNDAAALEGAITENTAAFMVEPIQGEAGVIVPDKGYLKEVRRICTKNDVLFVLDEVQTGFCRTGKRFCWMHEDARPDIMQVGKALGGGVYPVSGIVADRSIMDVFTPGSHGSTFGGNPLASAVGIAALSVLEDERLDEKAAENGKHFMETLSHMPQQRIKEVRGKGLLVGVELQVSAGKARPYCLKLKEEGILAKDTHAQTIRFAPPLITEMTVLRQAAGTIMKVLVP
ncbi:MAG: ornithine--oxo-acid transaminase [Candidatus Thermoplasmatota archaeon]|jgi:ornithine--oxo-acid transaminase|nr:ornithine--oxo-acid transaminase [Candidatus Thermoplasmatota archaeon]